MSFRPKQATYWALTRVPNRIAAMKTTKEGENAHRGVRPCEDTPFRDAVGGENVLDAPEEAQSKDGTGLKASRLGSFSRYS